MVALPGGGTIAYAYDAVGRRTGIDYSDATPDVTYVYDDAGRTVQMLDGTGATTYSYDDLNRLTGTTHAGASVGYAWDDVSRLTALTYPSGDVVTRAYDDAGQLATVTDWAGREFGFAWTDDGQLDQVSYPNGLVTSYGRDVAGQVTGLTAASQAGLGLLELAYSYSDAGLMTDRSATRGTEVDAAQFAWDPLARLDAVVGTGAGDVGFDAAGSVTVLPDGRQLTYDAGRQLTTLTLPGADDTVVSTGFSYDARGNRLTATTDTGPGAGTVTHTYDLANRLTSITGVDEAVTTYAYDGNGLRASATTGEATESFTWDLAAGGVRLDGLRLGRGLRVPAAPDGRRPRLRLRHRRRPPRPDLPGRRRCGRLPAHRHPRLRPGHHRRGRDGHRGVRLRRVRATEAGRRGGSGRRCDPLRLCRGVHRRHRVPVPARPLLRPVHGAVPHRRPARRHYRQPVRLHRGQPAPIRGSARAGLGSHPLGP